MKTHPPRRPSRPGSGGFSLVEVTVALGIAVFALVPIYGMLPVSFQVLKEADDRAVSNQVFGGLAEGIRDAACTASTYTLAGAFSGTRVSGFSGVSWSVGGRAVALPAVPVGEAGQPETGGAARYVIAGQITPPQADGTAGMARLSVAWPATATFDPGSFTWSHAAGSREFTMYFLSKNP